METANLIKFLPQKENILSHLEDGKSITPIEALNKFGCFRLAARIFELREEGHDIICEKIKIKNGKKIGVYTMV